jgi:hypothetical protein
MPKRRRRTGTAAALTLSGSALWLVAACNLLLENSELSPNGGGSDASADRIGTDSVAESSTIVDGHKEGSADASPDVLFVDAGKCTPITATEEASDYCARIDASNGANAVCDDFDTDAESAPFSLWQPKLLDGGTLVRASKPVVSPPFALHVEAPPPVTGNLSLQKNFESSGISGVMLAFDLWIDAWPDPDAGGYASAATVGFNLDDGGTPHVDLELVPEGDGGTGSLYVYFAPLSVASAQAPIPFRSWARIFFEVSLTARGFALTVDSCGGNPTMIDFPPGTSLPESAVPGYAGVGFTYVSPGCSSSTPSVYIDNVVITATP